MDDEDPVPVPVPMCSVGGISGLLDCRRRRRRFRVREVVSGGGGWEIAEKSWADGESSGSGLGELELELVDSRGKGGSGWSGMIDRWVELLARSIVRICPVPGSL